MYLVYIYVLFSLIQNLIFFSFCVYDKISMNTSSFFIASARSYLYIAAVFIGFLLLHAV